jgi:hypothetical protein
VAGASTKKRDGKVVQKHFRVIRLRDGKVARVTNVVQEVFQGKGSGQSHVERTTGRGGPDEAYGDASESDRFGERSDAEGERQPQGPKPHFSPHFLHSHFCRRRR